MEFLDLNAAARTTKGNGPARALRREGRFPAVLYGPKTEPEMLSVDETEFRNMLKKRIGKHQLINLAVEDSEKNNRKVMIKEMQIHPLSRRPLHADFYELDMEKKIRIRVPVQAVGKSVGVELGGLLQIIRRELEVICAPDQIPEAIVIDVTDLNVGDAVHIEEIVKEGLEFPAEVNFTVITVLGAKGKGADEEAEGEEEETEGETAEADA